jgi:hypothetical protein
MHALALWVSDVQQQHRRREQQHKHWEQQQKWLLAAGQLSPSISGGARSAAYTANLCTKCNKVLNNDVTRTFCADWSSVEAAGTAPDPVSAPM